MTSMTCTLLDDGSVMRGYLGVVIQDLSPELIAALELDVESGILVSDVVDDGPADDAGFERGDVIVELDGEPVGSSARFRSTIAALGPDADFQILVIRDGERHTLEGSLDLLGGASTPDAGPPDDEGALLGVELDRIRPEDRAALGFPDDLAGVLVPRVALGSPAHRGGVRSGDVILEVNRHRVSSPKDVRREVAESGNVLLLLYRDGSTLFVVISP